MHTIFTLPAVASLLAITALLIASRRLKQYLLTLV